MSEHTLLVLFEGAAGPLLVLILGGIVSIHVRLARIETKIGPMWDWWNSTRRSEGKE